MKKIEDKFEQDDYLNIGKLESAFNITLIYSFYNYAKKIITDESNTWIIIYIKLLSIIYSFYHRKKYILY